MKFPSRTLAALTFFGGVLLAVAFGCVLAAHDLWGGVPRTHARPMAGLLFGSALLSGGGAFWWIVAWPKGQRLKGTLWALLVVALAAALIGGGLFWHYAARLEPSRQTCLPARIAPLRADRQAALARGLGPLFPVIDPAYDCLALKRELDELARRETCPAFPPQDVFCLCGQERSYPRAPRCASQPTTCQVRTRSDALGLGCPEGEYAEMVRAAQRLRAEAK